MLPPRQNAQRCLCRCGEGLRLVSGRGARFDAHAVGCWRSVNPTRPAHWPSPGIGPWAPLAYGTGQGQPVSTQQRVFLGTHRHATSTGQQVDTPPRLGVRRLARGRGRLPRRLLYFSWIIPTTTHSLSLLLLNNGYLPPPPLCKPLNPTPPPPQ